MNQKLKDTVNNLSLNFSLGSIISAAMYARALHVELSWMHYLVLSLSVWLAYAYDHLSDSRYEASKEVKRYAFHGQYEKPLKIVMVLFGLIILSCLPFLPLFTLVSGGFVLLVSLAYFFGLKKWKFVRKRKEPIAALCIALGVVGIVAANSFLAEPIKSSLYFLGFYFVCLLNLYLFSWFDRHKDEKLNFSSPFTSKTEQEYHQWMQRLFLVGFVVNIAGFIIGLNLLVFACVTLMIVALYVLFIREEDYVQNDDFRFYGDLIFIIPLVSILALMAT